MHAESSGAPRRFLPLLAVVAVVAMLAVVLLFRPTGASDVSPPVTPAASDSSASSGVSDCEEEPPATSFTLAECDGGGDAAGSPEAQPEEPQR